MMPEPCWDFASGEALAGKAAEIVGYTKGSCTPNGGELVGKVKLDKQVTICCPYATIQWFVLKTMQRVTHSQIHRSVAEANA